MMRNSLIYFFTALLLIACGNNGKPQRTLESPGDMPVPQELAPDESLPSCEELKAPLSALLQKGAHPFLQQMLLESDANKAADRLERLRAKRLACKKK